MDNALSSDLISTALSFLTHAGHTGEGGKYNTSFTHFITYARTLAGGAGSLQDVMFADTLDEVGALFSYSKNMLAITWSAVLPNTKSVVSGVHGAWRLDVNAVTLDDDFDAAVDSTNVASASFGDYVGGSVSVLYVDGVGLRLSVVNSSDSAATYNAYCFGTILQWDNNVVD